MDVFVFQILSLNQSLETNLKGVNIEQFLNLTDDLSINLYAKSITQKLLFKHEAKISKTINVQATSVFALSQDNQPKVSVGNAEDTLFMICEASQNHGPHLQQELLFSQIASCELAKYANDVLVFTQSAEVHFTKNVLITQTIVFKSNGVVFEENVCWNSFPIVI